MPQALRERNWERIVGVTVVVGAVGFVFFQLHPELLFRNTTPNGGDTGAHVWWPDYLRHHVFTKWRLSGWTQDYYAGFPVGHFYFPLAAVLVSLFELVLPYNVAFKLVTALGPMLLPVAAYALARGLKAPAPAPPLFAAATLPYLFFRGYTIYGGNLPSTLAGEFSFSIALALALFFLGSLAHALDERRRFWLPALLLGLTVMSHIIVAAFAAVGALVVWLARRPVRNLGPAAAIGFVAFLVSAIWSLPMVGRLAYATDMGWTRLTQYSHNLLHPDLKWAVVLAGVALVAGAALARRVTFELAALLAVFALGFRFLPEGRLWNARLLPFYDLMLVFLAALGVAEIVGFLRAAVASDVVRTWMASARQSSPTGGPDAGAPAADDPVADDLVGRSVTARAWLPKAVTVVFTIGALAASVAWSYQTRGFIPGWITWNNSGYEAKPAYPEYREIMDIASTLPPGRLVWERLAAINNYGSDLALELLPYFTRGRISSMEGLYFESSATTPYHFMTVAELAKEPSNPVRGLPYRSIADFDLGVRHLQLLGVRYLMLGSDEAKARADRNPNLRFLLETGRPDRQPQVARWRIYEVQDAPLVEPLQYEPVVLDDVAPHAWRKANGAGPSVDWFNDPSALDRVWAAGGPAQWARVSAAGAARAERTPVPGARDLSITQLQMTEDSVRFHVSRTGVPVLVKVSYFPNWQVRGARGPWRVTPNFMVVVPTSNDVVLHYGRTPIDRIGIVLTLLGLVGLVALARWRLAPLPALVPGGRAAGPGGDGARARATDLPGVAESEESVPAPSG